MQLPPAAFDLLHKPAASSTDAKGPTTLHMPGLTGVELHRRLLADGFAVPTIFITGLPDETTRAQVLAAGAVAFLSKPVGGKFLSDCLKIALIRRSS